MFIDGASALPFSRTCPRASTAQPAQQPQPQQLCGTLHKWSSLSSLQCLACATHGTRDMSSAPSPRCKGVGVHLVVWPCVRRLHALARKVGDARAQLRQSGLQYVQVWSGAQRRAKLTQVGEQQHAHRLRHTHTHSWRKVQGVGSVHGLCVSLLVAAAFATIDARVAANSGPRMPPSLSPK